MSCVGSYQRALLPVDGPRAGRAVAHCRVEHGADRPDHLPRRHPDLDEVAYQSQANALSDGHMRLSAATHDPFFRPFLSGLRDDHVVFKYQPVWRR